MAPDDPAPDDPAPDDLTAPECEAPAPPDAAPFCYYFDSDALSDAGVFGG